MKTVDYYIEFLLRIVQQKKLSNIFFKYSTYTIILSDERIISHWCKVHPFFILYDNIKILLKTLV